MRVLLGVIRMDRVPNQRVRELCGVTNGLDETINESVLRWFTHVERMGNERIVKRYIWGVYGISLVGRSLKRGIDSLNNCLKKNSLDVE